MKNIQDIMSEMNNLSEQIATTLNEEEIKVLANEDLALAEVAACSNPVDCTVSRDVPFCCILDVPSNLGITKDDSNRRIIYSLDCLRCIVEPCSQPFSVCGCPAQNITVYNVKIVGCIPFLINHAVLSTECSSADNTRAFLCCHDSVCVDNVICIKCDQAQANTACNIINGKLANCACTAVQFNLTTDVNCSDGKLKGLDVSGKFILPNCNPACTTCTPQPCTPNCNPADGEACPPTP